MDLISERTAAAFEAYFPNHKPKLAYAKLIRCCANVMKIMTSRVKYDSKDHLHSALGDAFTEVCSLPSYYRVPAVRERKTARGDFSFSTYDTNALTFILKLFISRRTRLQTSKSLGKNPII